MTHRPPPIPTPVHQTFAQRCRDLNILCWLANPDGRLIAEPSDLVPFFSSSTLHTLIQTAASSCAGQSTIPFAGATLVAFPESHGSRHISTTLALTLCGDLLDSPQFPEMCAAAALDPGRIRPSLEPFLRPAGAKLNELISLLRWMHEDLVRQHRNRSTLDQMGEKLAQAYEENNLIFRLARFLNSTAAPAESIQTVCSQLRQTLPFGWLGAYFHPRAQLAEVADRLVLAGSPPCDAGMLRDLCAAAVTGESDASTRILNPKDNAIAAAVNAEVIVEPITSDGRVIGALLAGNKKTDDPEASSFEMQFLDAAANFLSIFHENVARFAQQRQLFLGMLQSLTAAIDAKDPYTSGHSQRVGLIASLMARALKLDDKEVELYRIAGLVHDVGKIGVPESVLTKQGRLTASEIEHMQKHPEIGYRILKNITLLQDALPAVLHHHERFDGFGYPSRVAGQNIPFIARVLSLADTFDAMSSNRSYRDALPRATILQEIRRCAGTQFDPDLVPIFLSLDFSQFDELLGHQGLRQAA
jgi:HD-GYP domain-containing protein (c-di-GMP phosphodiesterase class II)